jgi:hypothetical protein
MSEIDRINKKILDCHMMLSAIYDIIGTLVEELSQEEVDKLLAILEQYYVTEEAMRNAVQTFVKNIVNEDNEEIDVVPTENGLKI